MHVVLQSSLLCVYYRYDVSKITRPCLLKACTLQSGAIAAFLYTTALCINVSLARMDDRLGPKTNVTTDALRDFATVQVCHVMSLGKLGHCKCECWRALFYM